MDIDHRGRAVSKDGKWRWDGKQWRPAGQGRRPRAVLFILLAGVAIVLAVLAAASFARPHPARHAENLPELTQNY